MRAGDRFKGWIDGLAESWKDRLHGWMMSWVDKGLDSFFRSREPEIINFTRETLTKIRDTPDITPEMRNMIDKSLVTGDIASVVGGWMMIIIGAIPALMGLGVPLGRSWEYYQDRILQTFRLDPMSVITAWRRDPEKYAPLFEDLRDAGWTDERLEALKFLTQFMPSAIDIVSWYAREVYEPDMVNRYGLGDELPNYEETDFPKIGVDSTQASNYWRAHWEHASFMQVIEMLHRGILSLDKTTPTPPTTIDGWATRDAEGEAALYDWYRLVEIPPFWRDRLTAISWNVPTRVDVRRWWDMRTISEAELRNVYHRQGYHGTDLDNYVLWTKVYTDFPSLLARWSKGWITEDDVRRELITLGMPAARVETMIQEKIKPEEAARVEEGKTLTKTEIYKGVKQGFITREEGTELIMDLGYNRAEAEYLVDINVAVLEGSPETFAEFKDLTTKYKIATGREETPMPEELKLAAAEVVRLTKEVEALERSIEEEKRGLFEVELLPGATTAKLKELQVGHNRAIAELERVKSEYNRLVAEWQYGPQSR